uniref:PI3K/PI4K catalytic domain-containing protein n=1 Tax=Ditylenchus dipsaci TaxID=166011 RepID=A0A915D3U7_9BILA
MCHRCLCTQSQIHRGVPLASHQRKAPRRCCFNSQATTSSSAETLSSNLNLLNVSTQAKAVDSALTPATLLSIPPEKGVKEQAAEKASTDTGPPGGTGSSFSARAAAKTSGTEVANKAIEKEQIYWQDPMPPMSLSECKTLVRFLIQPVKMMVVALPSAGEAPHPDSHDIVQLLSDFFVHGLKCLDIFMLGNSSGSSSSYQKAINSSGIRSKDEKEAIEAFTAIYTSLDSKTFFTIINEHIERITNHNHVLQSISAAFFGHQQTAAKMGTVLVQFLLKKLPEMGFSNEKASLYLKMFKLVFNAVSCTQVTSDCENMLKPFLHEILLRALFRSIGSGAHDLLYQQFLPLLPSILQQLNRLQNSSHRQPIHELFVELCLTVPVRLSSLLPYLPLLMDPLVCALYGSPTLVQQGLRTLELCVDNLQPEYFYDHMAPVRSALMQGLWRTVSSNDFQSALSAFRILGKFGGSSRKVLLDAQTMDYEEDAKTSCPIALTICYSRQKADEAKKDVVHDVITDSLGMEVDPVEQKPLLYSGQGGLMEHVWCDIPLLKLVESAANVLRTPQNGEVSGNNNNNNHSNGKSVALPKSQAFEIIKTVLLNCLSSSKIQSIDDIRLKKALEKALKHANSSIEHGYNKSPYICSDKHSRSLFATALTGLFFAVMNNELRSQSLVLFRDIIRHLTIQAIMESLLEDFNDDTSCLDAMVLIDALKTTLADPIKDFCHTVIAVLRYIIDTATVLCCGDADGVCQLPFFTYLLDQISLLCYRREYYTRLGGCTALRFIIENYPTSFVRKQAAVFLNAFLEITSGLADEVSSGALDFASKSMDMFLPICFSSSQSDEDPTEEFLNRLFEHLDDPEALLRNECIRVLGSICQLKSISMAELLAGKKAMIASTIAHKINNFVKLSIDSQIGFLSFYSFVVDIDHLEIDIPSELLTLLMRNLMCICDSSEHDYHSLAAKLRLTPPVGQGDLSPSKKINLLRSAAIGAIISRYLKVLRSSPENPSATDSETSMDELFGLLLKNALTENSKNSSLLEESASGVRKIAQISSSCHQVLSTQLMAVSEDFRQKNEKLTPDFLRKLIFLNEISSSKISPDDINYLIVELNKVLRTDISELQSDDLKSVSATLQLLCHLGCKNAELSKTCLTFFSNIQHHLQLNMNNERWLESLLQFTCLNAEEGVAVFLLTIDNLQNRSLSTLTFAFLKHKNGDVLRKVMMEKVDLLIQIIRSEQQPINSFVEMAVLQVVWLLAENDPNWLYQQTQMYQQIRNLWNSIDFKERYSVRKPIDENEIVRKFELMDRPKFDTPAFCARILLSYLRSSFSSNKTVAEPANDSETIDLLYDLIFVFCHTFISDFMFLRSFIDEHLELVSLQWRREAFKKVVRMLKEGPGPDNGEQLVRFMQYVVAPAFHHAFEKHDTDSVVGSAPDPEQQNDDNVVSLLCSEVIQQENRVPMSDAMAIVMYQFCVLLVQKCPAHIHDMTKKQQGTRLRSFMLFGWPCLQANFQRDLTEKYAGHLLIANIIDKFAINRRIVLQVLNSLVMAHQQDHKEITKKALDILIPAVPRRMDDGYDQLCTMIKKVIVEESRSTTQVTIHCLTIIIRHYKVFYYVRHQLAGVILSGLQRLLSVQFGFDSRRLVIDVCDMFIKWEQERQKAFGVADTTTAVLKSPSTQNEAPHEATAEDRPTEQASEAIPPTGAPSSTNDAFEKSVVDQVVLLLVKIATSSTEIIPGSAASNSNLEAISKRSIVLLRLAMKPNIFGQVATLKSHWFEKLLSLPNAEQFSVEPPSNHQLSQVQVALDVLSNITNYLPQQVAVELFRPLQRSIICCLNCPSAQIVRSSYNVISKLMERTTSSATGLNDFELLNNYIAKHIHDSFSTYFCATSNLSQLTYMTITLLRIMCSIQAAYLDTVCLTPFLKTLQRLARDYVPPTTPYGSSTAASSSDRQPTMDQNQKFIADILVICLEMLCPRIHAISPEAKKGLSQLVLVPLIEKNAVDKVIDVVIKAINKIVIDPTSTNPLGIPLLARMSLTLEARLLSNADLLRSFLNCVLFVFENEHTLETAAKLNTAFSGDYAALIKIFVQDILWCWKKLPKRNFRENTPYNVQRELAADGSGEKSNSAIDLMKPKNCATLGTTFERILEKKVSSVDEEHQEDIKNIEKISCPAMEVEDVEPMEVDEPLENTSGIIVKQDAPGTSNTDDNQPDKISLSETETRVTDQGADQKKSLTVDTILEHEHRLLQMAAESRLKETSTKLIANLVAFLHYDWKTARIVFIEFFRSFYNQLTEEEKAKPSLLKYLATTHNCWHLVVNLLEKEAGGIRLFNDPCLINSNNQPTQKLEILDHLEQLYKMLSENDQLWMVWKKRAYFDKTEKCLALFHQGEFSQARELSEKLMIQLNERLSRPILPAESFSSVSPALNSEVRMWENTWISSCKELNDWSTLLKFSNTEKVADCDLLMESAWHLQDWSLLGECVVQVDACADPKSYVKCSLFKVMNNIINSSFESTKEGVEKSLVDINKFLISEWRRMPNTVSSSHLGLLRDAHLVHEVTEASNILQPSPNTGGTALNNSVRHVMKSWRSRPLTAVDSVSSWLDIFNWRFQHYNTIIKLYEKCNDQGNPMAQQATQQTFLLHSLAQSQLSLALALRRSNQMDMALNALNVLHSLPSLHPMDAQLKVHEHVKCLLKLAASPNTAAVIGRQTPQDALYDALDVMENTQLQFLKRDQIARLMITKGIVLSKLDKRDEAGRAFTAAAVLDDSMGTSNSSSVWKHWGKHLENLFLNNHIESTALNTGLQAIGKSVLATKSGLLLWPQLTEPLEEVLKNNANSIPPANWLFWVNEIIADIRQRQAVFYALRVNLDPAVITKRIQQNHDKMPSFSDWSVGQRLPQTSEESDVDMEQEQSKSPTNWTEKLLSVVDSMCIDQPANMVCLNNILNELDNFPIGAVEKVLDDMKSILKECHDEAFANVAEVAGLVVSKDLRGKVNNLASSLVENSAEEEIPADLYSRLTADLESAKEESFLLHQLAALLRSWTSILINFLKSNQTQCRLRSVSKYLTNFKSKMAQIDVFSGPICPRVAQYSAQISQFMPIYHYSVKHDTVSRLIMIRSLNGKIYSYFLEKNKYDMAESYIFQLFSMLNTEFSKDRGTCQRLIQFAIPQVLQTGTNFRLTECSPMAGTSTQLQGNSGEQPLPCAHNFIDIFDEMLAKETSCKSAREIVDHYYSRLMEQRYCHKTLLNIFNEISVETTNGAEAKCVPKNLLTKWITAKYPHPTNLWISRKNLSVQFALLGLAEHTLFLTPMNLDGLRLDLSTSQLFYMNYRFDLIELDGNRPVAFRVSPNIAHFLDLSIEGHLSGALIAIAKCLNNRSIDHLLRPILWDTFCKTVEDNVNVMNPVKRALDTVLSRIKHLAQFEGGNSPTTGLLISSHIQII